VSGEFSWRGTAKPLVSGPNSFTVQAAAGGGP
jgi:hypothetical protein